MINFTSIKNAVSATLDHPRVAKAINYAKENPADIILGIMAVTMLEIDDSLDHIEEMEEVQTIIDINNYRG